MVGLRHVFSAKVILTLICFFTLMLVSLPTAVLAHVSQSTTHSTHQGILGLHRQQANQQIWHVQYAQDYPKDHPAQGAGGNFDIYRPSVPIDNPDQDIHSLAQLGVWDSSLRALELGWVVAPNLYKDNAPHLLVFTRQEFFSNGCDPAFDPNKCDFQKLPNAHYYPGYTIDETQTPQAGFKVEHYQGKWYIAFANEWFGFFPDYHWQNNFKEVDTAAWWGEVTADTDSPCILMGNGLFGHQDHSAIINNMFFYDDKGGHPPATIHRTLVEKPQYYDDGHATGNSFTYGGPGAGCGSLVTKLTPDSGPSGTSVTAQGSGWIQGSSGPGDQICIWWDTINNIPLACTTLLQDGTWIVNFTVPANQSTGQHLVTIVDMNAPNTRDTVTFTVT